MIMEGYKTLNIRSNCRSSSDIEAICVDNFIGKNCEIDIDELQIGENVYIGNNVKIAGREVIISSNVRIENDVRIEGDLIGIGYRTKIESRCSISAIGDKASKIIIGDCTTIAHDTTILVPVLEVGDYTSIHNHVLVNGYKPCTIGHNCFFGQHTVLNSTEELWIGNNVRQGVNGSIYTHAASGELLEGCNIFNKIPTVIEDNVWLIGSNTSVSSGLRLGNGSIILMGSVVTKDTLPRHCYGGVPAKDITDKMNPYHTVKLNDKADMMFGFIEDFVRDLYNDKHQGIEGGYRISPNAGKPWKIIVKNELTDNDIKDDEVLLAYVKRYSCSSDYSKVTIFDLSTKTYTKRLSDPEIQIIRYMNGYRARFVPQAQPCVGTKPRMSKKA